MTTLSRRQFLRRIAMLPAMAAAPLAQWPYSEESEPPGADTAANLTWRVTSLEAKNTVILAILNDINKAIRQIENRLKEVGPWPDRPRRT